MKKVVIFILLLLGACSNVDKKQYYYNNAVKLNVVFDEELRSFKNGYLRISLWSEDEGNQLIDEEFVYDVSHSEENTNNKKILVNFDYGNQKTKELYVTVELFADMDNDGLMENYLALSKENKLGFSNNYYTFRIR